MNENRIVDLLNTISTEAGGELKVASGNAPLVSSTEYQIANTDIVLNIKIRKAAATSALNKNITLNFRLPDLQCTPFSVRANTGFFSFLRNSIKYKVRGDENQKITKLLLSELNEKHLYGVRNLTISASNVALSMEFKTLYLESLEAMLMVLLKIVERFRAKPPLKK